MTETRFHSAGSCRTCRTPMVSRPHGATADQCPPGHRFHYGRGLCGNCSSAARRAGTITRWPRRSRSRDELLDDWALVRDTGVTYAEFASRVGMHTPTFLRALERARAAGDPRALHSIPALHHMGVPA